MTEMTTPASAVDPVSWLIKGRKIIFNKDILRFYSSKAKKRVLSATRLRDVIAPSTVKKRFFVCSVFFYQNSTY